MSERVTACPECDSTRIRKNVGESVVGRVGSGHDWYCGACGVLFDDAVEREKYCDGGPTRGLAADLAAAEPDEVRR